MRIAVFYKFLIVFVWSVSSFAFAQKVADFPCKAASTTSSDGRFIIEAPPCGSDANSWDRRIWLKDQETGERRLLLEFSRDVRIGWAPKGNYFFLNENASSSDAEAYVYIPTEDRRLDLINWIDDAFPRDRRFEHDSHHYVNVIRWNDANTVVVRRTGHFDLADAGAFTVCYVVGLDVTVKRIDSTYSEGSNCP
ncbi:MAG TPA: hypothetical protein VMT82_00390 [candidate division Zixibacteria bacterium]|nr:hypothetical protein [candidate division Zixibacteria bacterium]